MIKAGVIIQGSFFIYVLAQAFIGPVIVGVEEYGRFVIAFAPVLVLAGVFEPLIQKMVIAFDREKSCSLASLFFQFKSWFISFYAFSFVIIKLWSMLIDWNWASLLAASFFCYTVSIFHIAFLYREASYYKVALANIVCLSLYVFGLTIAYALSQSSEMLGVAFLASQFGLLIFSFNKRFYIYTSGKISESFSAIFVSAMSWRLSYIVYYSGFFALLPFFRSEQYIGIMKIVFSALSSSRFVYPVTVPVFLKLIAERKISVICKHLVGMLLVFSVLSALLYLFSDIFYSFFLIEYSDVDDWVYFVVPVYLLLPAIMVLIEDALGSHMNLIIGVCFAIVLAGGLFILDINPMLILLLTIFSHMAVVCFLFLRSFKV